ncbi:MAG: hypothetical protein GY830_08365 [Bacteroidetes bacterium]|nr:hypothetical protein [Bacteroidota bacterium]
MKRINFKYIIYNIERIYNISKYRNLINSSLFIFSILIFNCTKNNSTFTMIKNSSNSKDNKKSEINSLSFRQKDRNQDRSDFHLFNYNNNSKSKHNIQIKDYDIHIFKQKSYLPLQRTKDKIENFKYLAKIESTLPNVFYKEIIPTYFSDNTNYKTFISLDENSQRCRIHLNKRRNHRYIIISKELPGGFFGWLCDTVTFVFSAVTYPIAKVAHEIYLYFRGDNETVKAYLRDIADLEDEIDNLGIDELNDIIENLSEEQKRALNELSKQENIIKEAKANIKKYEKLLIKCESNLNADLIDNDGKSIDEAKLVADLKIQELQNTFDENWKEKTKLAKEYVNIFNEIIKYTNEANIRKVKYSISTINSSYSYNLKRKLEKRKKELFDIISRQMIQEICEKKYATVEYFKVILNKPNIELDYSYNFYNNETIPPYVNQMSKIINTVFEYKFTGFEDKLVRLGDEHSILDLIYKIKVELKKIRRAKKDSKKSKRKTNNLNKEIDKHKTELIAKEKIRDKLADQIDNLYEKIANEREREEFPSFLEYHKNNRKGVEKFLNNLNNGIRRILNSKGFKYFLIGAVVVAAAVIIAVIIVKSGGLAFLVTKGGGFLSKIGTSLGFGGKSTISAGGIKSFISSSAVTIKSFIQSKVTLKTALTFAAPAFIYYGIKNIPFNFNFSNFQSVNNDTLNNIELKNDLSIQDMNQNQSISDPKDIKTGNDSSNEKNNGVVSKSAIGGIGGGSLIVAGALKRKEKKEEKDDDNKNIEQKDFTFRSNNDTLKVTQNPTLLQTNFPTISPTRDFKNFINRDFKNSWDFYIEHLTKHKNEDLSSEDEMMNDDKATINFKKPSFNWRRCKSPY